MMDQQETCLDNGQRHAWHGTGLDIVNGRCVYTARCVWCQKTAVRTSPLQPPFRSSVRAKA